MAKTNLLLYNFSHVSSAARSIKPLREAEYSCTRIVAELIGSTGQCNFCFQCFSWSLGTDCTVITQNLRILLSRKHLRVRRAPHVNSVAFLRVI